MELQNACFRLVREEGECLDGVVSPAPFALEVLETILLAGHDMILISNTRKDGLELYLKHLGLAKFFDGRAFATFSHSRNAAKKLDIVASFIQKRDYESVVSVGDSDADVAIAHAYGGVSFLYAGEGRPFRDCQATYKIRDLRAVLKVV